MFRQAVFIIVLCTMLAVSSFRSMPSASRNVVRSYKSTTVSMGFLDGKWNFSENLLQLFATDETSLIATIYCTHSAVKDFLESQEKPPPRTFLWRVLMPQFSCKFRHHIRLSDTHETNWIHWDNITLSMVQNKVEEANFNKRKCGSSFCWRSSWTLLLPQWQKR